MPTMVGKTVTWTTDAPRTGGKQVPRKHRQDCIDAHARYKVEKPAYEERWPDYCRSCNGQQGHSYTENGAPHGAGYWPRPMWEPCEDCYDKCPRCGVDLNQVLPDSLLVDEVCRQLDKQEALAIQNGYYFPPWFMDWLDKVEIWDEQELPCPECGWNRGKNADDYCPEEPECWCWEDDHDLELEYFPGKPSVYEEFADLYEVEQPNTEDDDLLCPRCGQDVYDDIMVSWENEPDQDTTLDIECPKCGYQISVDVECVTNFTIYRGD